MNLGTFIIASYSLAWREWIQSIRANARRDHVRGELRVEAMLFTLEVCDEMEDEVRRICEKA